MRNKSIAIPIPYFGKLPAWFELFLMSAGKSEKIDFLLFTDDDAYYDYPLNFKVFNISYEEFQNIFYNKLGNVYLGHPYKLCEYKPCYGYVLNDYLKGYDFWGHCDIDLIFGDLDSYLEKISLEEYDRIFTYGHLSIYKNVERVNKAFKLELGAGFPKVFKFSFVSKTTYSCNFDEIGINVILKEYGFKVYENSFFANVNESFKRFRIHSGLFDFPSILVYKNNKVLEIKKKENQIVQNELMYLHFQNRKSLKIDSDIVGDFLISDEGFIKYDSNQLEKYLTIYGDKESDEEQNKYYSSFLSDKRKKTYLKIIKEFKHSNIMLFGVLYNLYTAKKWLSKNNIR
ncbi:DUF6625 family protein [Flavobacterium flavipallidum]|uniref:DUF6625 family protein n=1 Tax=Flavobacterium flavipallidum TaxID=3139140 RepID=A0ABU9HK07_9FLAO